MACTHRQPHLGATPRALFTRGGATRGDHAEAHTTRDRAVCQKRTERTASLLGRVSAPSSRRVARWPWADAIDHAPRSTERLRDLDACGPALEAWAGHCGWAGGGQADSDSVVGLRWRSDGPGPRFVSGTSGEHGESAAHVDRPGRLAALGAGSWERTRSPRAGATPYEAPQGRICAPVCNQSIEGGPGSGHVVVVPDDHPEDRGHLAPRRAVPMRHSPPPRTLITRGE